MPMYTEREVMIDRILPNPFRDFDINPIHQSRIDQLVYSYRDGLGKDFGTIIPVRPHPTREGYYEQACGHHRVRALKQLGQLKVLCQIDNPVRITPFVVVPGEDLVKTGTNLHSARRIEDG